MAGQAIGTATLTKRRLLPTGRPALAAGAVGPLTAACGAWPGCETAPAMSKGPVSLLYWRAFMPQQLNDRAVQMVFDDYQAKNPGRVTIEVGEAGANAALAKVKTALAADAAPTMWNPYQVQATELF